MTRSPGTLTVVANGTDWRTVTPEGVSVILDLSSLAVAVPPPDRLAGVYASTSPAQIDVSAALTRAAALHTRVFCCWDDSTAYPAQVLAALPAYSVPLLEAYQAPRSQPNETLGEAIARWTRNAWSLAAAWAWDWGIIPQGYLGGTTLERVLAAQAPTIQIINTQPRCKAAIAFAWDRLNGGQIPALADAMRAFCAASPGPAGLLPIPPPARLPTATILKGVSVNVYAKLNGKYIGVDPAHPTVVYSDRMSANGWEAITLTQLADKRFSAKFDAAGVYLSIIDTGALETRPAVGDWESLCAINPPTEYQATPSQLYQPVHGTVLQLEKQ